MADIDEQIIEVLQDGPNTPKNIADQIGYSQEYVWMRLNQELEQVEKTGYGLYRLEGASKSTADAEMLTDLRDRVGRLKMELTKQNETPDELWDRADEIHKSLKNALKELDD